MKQSIKFLSMLLMAIAMSFSFTSCGNDDDEPDAPAVFKLAGTTWQYIDHDSSDGVDYKATYSFRFAESSANYELVLEIREGSTTYTDRQTIHYTYTYNNGLVVFSPTEAGKAYLEGVIISEMKMVVTNTSTGKEIGTFYKI